MATTTTALTGVQHFFDDAGIPRKIPYVGVSASPSTGARTPSLAFRYYNADEVILGKPMKEWLRFAVCYWHTFRGNGLDMFGQGTINRPWDDGSNSLDNAIRRIRVAFDFMQRIGVEYWTFHDRDIAPTGETLAETNTLLDQVVQEAKALQALTGIKLLWGTANLFGHPRYMNGAATNPDANVFAYAAAQVKKAIEVTKELGGQNYVFWGGREGYQSVLNTNIPRELDHFASFLKMAVAYKKKIGFEGVFLIEPKPREPTKHQYDYDAQTTIGFLRQHGLESEFKLNIEPNHTTLAGHDYEHDIIVSSMCGMLGSIDANTGDNMVGWDTDQFNMDVKKATLLMHAVIKQGGIAPGGLNFDCKVRRESVDVEDLFISHISAMDTFAHGLRCAAAIITDGILSQMVSQRYSTFDSGIGARVENHTTTFEELEHHALTHPEPIPTSAKQEKFEVVFSTYSS
ncbi:xylose isomerase [Pelomyxa schiedti]|nr:xylose isomerase [Pelomyxa schiedti]